MRPDERRIIAEALFERVRARFGNLCSLLSDTPIPQIDLELQFDAQPELIFPVAATLQGDAICLSVGGTFWGEWFPCTRPQVVAEFEACLSGVLAGSVRLVEFSRNGKIWKSQLQECPRGVWEPAATWTTLRWPSLRRLDVQVRRNRPLSLREGVAIDQALLADLRDRSGDPTVSAGACVAIRQEAKSRDVPWLRSLLADRSPLVRGAVAASIADLEGLPALRDLLLAYGRVLDMNEEPDRLKAVLIELVADGSDEARSLLELLTEDADRQVRCNARWLLKYGLRH